ncbi:hypothetical protein KIL84_017796 [Mauremys mutica]|uniref:Uncharacterized protein n=1 Tax=Mauremys mutica TaxID=74926 RepID=A0A9D3X6X7_9SAUR|nr:hypothetical protein KIL84_017796 [Mauremys mutica]
MSFYTCMQGVTMSLQCGPPHTAWRTSFCSQNGVLHAHSGAGQNCPTGIAGQEVIVLAFIAYNACVANIEGTPLIQGTSGVRGRGRSQDERLCSIAHKVSCKYQSHYFHYNICMVLMSS